VRWLVVLAFGVGLGLGYLLGAAEDPEVPPRQSTRTEAPEVTPFDREGAPGEGPRESQPVVPRQSTPSRSERAEPWAAPGTGRLNLLVREPERWAEDAFQLIGSDMRGDVTSERLDRVDSGHYLIEAYAGQYTFEWDDGDRKRRMGIRILAGEERTVYLADLIRDPAPEPIPSGLGRLHVRLLDASREPIASAIFWVVGRSIAGEDVEGMRTDRAGEAFLYLRPGDYLVRVGGVEQRVSVPLEKAVECVIDHAAFGELRVPANFLGRVVLFVEGEAGQAAPATPVRNRGAVFVRPGSYRYHLLFDGQRGAGWHAGDVRIEAGRVARIEPATPAGSLVLELEVEPNAANVPHYQIPGKLRLASAKHELEVPLLLFRVHGGHGKYHTKLHRLPPGRWILKIAIAGYVPISHDVRIEGQPETLRLRLVRAE